MVITQSTEDVYIKDAGKCRWCNGSLAGYGEKTHHLNYKKMQDSFNAIAK